MALFLSVQLYFPLFLVCVHFFNVFFTKLLHVFQVSISKLAAQHDLPTLVALPVQLL